VLAEEIKLRCPEAAWHTHRDRLAALLAACGVMVGSLGKMARDIVLLAQNEVAEVAEPTAPERGGSSTMPHKQNPVGSAVALAAAQRVPGLVAGFLSAMVQEHERAVGGWQAEWSIISAIMQNTGLAISAMAQVAEGLTVNEVRMRANLEATRGVVFSERAAMLLGEKLGRDIAHKLVKEATRKAAAEQRNLSHVLAEMPAIADHLKTADLRDLENPEHYLGAAEEFRKRLLAAAGPATAAAKSATAKSKRKKKEKKR
jgi:3-carboxy-cis,cis-muconate cycloisomerase